MVSMLTKIRPRVGLIDLERCQVFGGIKKAQDSVLEETSPQFHSVAQLASTGGGEVRSVVVCVFSEIL